jgi:YVTN family beta-propeller protein
MKRFMQTLATLAFTVNTCPVTAQPARDNLVLVVNRAPKVLSVFRAEGANLALVKRIAIGDGAREVCVSPDGRRAYVSVGKENAVAVVDLEKLEVVATIKDPLLDGPDGGRVSSDSKTVYITSALKNSVVVIDAESNKVVRSIPTKGQAPRRLIISPDGKLMYVGFNKGDSVAVIDMATGNTIRSIKTGDEPRGGFAFTPDGKILLSAAVEGDTLAVVETETGTVKRIFGLPYSPQRVEMTPSGVAVVLSGGQGHSLTMIGNLMSHDKTRMVPVGKAAWGLALNEDSTISYSSNYADGTLTIVDLVNAKVLQTVEVGEDPNGVAYRSTRAARK